MCVFKVCVSDCTIQFWVVANELWLRIILKLNLNNSTLNLLSDYQFRWKFNNQVLNDIFPYAEQ